MTPRLRLRDFSVGFREMTTPWTAAIGGCAGLAGESGSGKTTLLKAVVGLLPERAVQRGTVQVDGRAGYIPQDPLSSLSPFLRVIEQVADVAVSRSAAESWLERLGLDARIARSYPHQLSGGERQRVLAAQALAMAPDILVADEPVANLDEASAGLVLEAIADYCQESGAALLIASHDERVFSRLGCQVHRLTPWSGWAIPPPDPVAENAPRVVCATSLSKAFGPTRVLDSVSLEVRAGETVALAGPSGAGKSTLARCIAGRERADSGSVEVAAAVQLVPQEPSCSLNPRFTVAEALAEASPRAGVDHLRKFELDPALLFRRTSELSEGQRARLAIARAVAALDGGLLILDESLSGLDPRTAEAILANIRDVQWSSGLGCLLITHDSSLANAAAHRICHLAQPERVY